jgi:hypothetical protein
MENLETLYIFGSNVKWCRSYQNLQKFTGKKSFHCVYILILKRY